jgi:hypothetical protein
MILQSRDNCSASELDLRYSNTYSSESGFALGVTPLENNDVDDVMHDLQSSIEKVAVERFRALSVWLGVAGPYGSKTSGDALNA